MIASTQVTNRTIFTFIAVLVFKLLSRRAVFVKQKIKKNLLKKRLLLKKMANFTGKLLQNY